VLARARVGERVRHEVGRHLGGDLGGRFAHGQLHEAATTRTEGGDHALVLVRLHRRDRGHQAHSGDPLPEHRGGGEGEQPSG
jgi:hypothetical protein